MTENQVQALKRQIEPRGRQAQTVVVAGLKQTLAAVARHGAKYLLECAEKKVRRPSPARIDVAKYAIDHVIGKATTKLALPVDSEGRTIIPYTAIIALAEGADSATIAPALTGTCPTCGTGQLAEDVVDVKGVPLDQDSAGPTVPMLGGPEKPATG